MDKIAGEARIRLWIRRWWKWVILGYLGIAIVGAIWNTIHPRAVTPEEQERMDCVKDWLDVNKVGEFAVSGSLTDRLIVAHKMCERAKPKP